MASILDKYGIKEVADVTFYKINDNGTPGEPVLYLDTLKVSTIEQTAEQAEARGGKGNPPLIIWDYGKEITVTLEDALFSAKSMAIMFGNGTVQNVVGTSGEPAEKIYKTIQFTCAEAGQSNAKWELPDGTTKSIPESVKYYDEKGKSTEVGSLEKDKVYYATFEVTGSDIGTIEISAQNFPGTYYVTGDTYARKEATGADEYFQFIIPKAKMNAENTITLEAEGDPSVFNMSLRVLRPADGKMMKLVKYNIEPDDAGGLSAKKTETITTNKIVG